MARARTERAVATWDALKGASWPIFTAIGERTAKAGLTPAQISLLNVLHDAEADMTPLSVAKTLGVRPATVTGTLDPLEEKGLIERVRGAREDRRVVLLRMTPAGRKLLRAWREACCEDIVRAMRPLADDELDALRALLARLAPPVPGVPEGLADRMRPARG